MRKMTAKAKRRDRIVQHIEGGIVLIIVVVGSYLGLALIDLLFKALGVG